MSDKWKHVQTLYGVQTNENMSRQAEEPLASVGQAVKQSVSRIAIKLRCLHSSMSLSIFVDLGNITLRKYSMTFCFSTPARQLGLC